MKKLIIKENDGVYDIVIETNENIINRLQINRYKEKSLFGIKLIADYKKKILRYINRKFLREILKLL